MLDRHARQVAELDRLLGDRVRAGDGRLRCDDRGRGRERDHRIERPGRVREVERVFDRLRVRDEQRALAEIVQHQRRRHQAEPGDADGALSEVAHVGVKRLGAGDRKQHGSKHHERGSAMTGGKAQGMDRVQRLEHRGHLRDVPYANRGEGNEPQRADRPEERADHAGPVPLDEEQRRPGFRLRSAPRTA